MILLAVFEMRLVMQSPPPGTIPSLIAALVAHIASSTLSFFSFNSTSELAPTLTIATLAFSLAKSFFVIYISIALDL